MQGSSAPPNNTSGADKSSERTNGGRSRTQIAEEVGFSYMAVSKTIARYEELGSIALAPRTRGRRRGEDRALSVEQEQAIQRTICDKHLEQLKMEFALRSRAAVMPVATR